MAVLKQAPAPIASQHAPLFGGCEEEGAARESPVAPIAVRIPSTQKWGFGRSPAAWAVRDS
jgi:hypothetical protein